MTVKESARRKWHFVTILKHENYFADCPKSRVILNDFNQKDVLMDNFCVLGERGSLPQKNKRWVSDWSYFGISQKSLSLGCSSINASRPFAYGDSHPQHPVYNYVREESIRSSHLSPNRSMLLLLPTCFCPHGVMPFGALFLGGPGIFTWSHSTRQLCSAAAAETIWLVAIATSANAIRRTWRHMMAVKTTGGWLLSLAELPEDFDRQLSTISYRCNNKIKDNTQISRI